MSTYATLTTRSGQTAMVFRNNTDNWVEIDKGVPIATVVSANHMPTMAVDFAASKPQEVTPTLTEAERQPC